MMQSEDEDVEQIILNTLLELSGSHSADWEPQFPLLDQNSVDKVSHAIAHILTQKNCRLIKPIVALTQKWCSVNGSLFSKHHSPWVGCMLTVNDVVSYMLTACVPLVRNENDWKQRDPEQQLALCYAFLGAATTESTALLSECRAVCALLVSRILNIRVLTREHHRFLAHVWDSRDILQLSHDVLEVLMKKSPLGLERSMLWLGRSVLKSTHNVPHPQDVWETSSAQSLLCICSQSPIAFQTVSSILTQMMIESGAQPYIQELVKHFVSGVEALCAAEDCDISALYSESCQVVSALLCLNPVDLPSESEKNSKNDLTRDAVLQMVHVLPHSSAAVLLSHRPLWLPYVMNQPSDLTLKSSVSSN